MSAVYLRTKKGNHRYRFRCPGCKCDGVLIVPVGQRGTFGCPEGCGATFVQWTNSETPTITAVVVPVLGTKS